MRTKNRIVDIGGKNELQHVVYKREMNKKRIETGGFQHEKGVRNEIHTERMQKKKQKKNIMERTTFKRTKQKKETKAC